MKILSFDTGYTTTGFCVYNTETQVINYGCFVTKKTSNKNNLDYYYRIKYQVQKIIELIKNEKPDVILMEAPSLFSKGNTFLQTAASNLIFQFFITKTIEENKMNIEFFVCPPRSLKKFFGSGKIEKKEIIEKIKEMNFENLKEFKNDELDDVADSIMFLIVFLKNNKKEITKKSNVIYNFDNFECKDFYEKKFEEKKEFNF